MPAEASDEALRIVHKSIAKVTDDLDRHAFNTVVSALMIAVNELSSVEGRLGQNALQPLAVLLSPYAPHLAEELWASAGGAASVLDAAWPVADSALGGRLGDLPVSFNGLVRFKVELASSMPPPDVEAFIRAHDKTLKQLGDKSIRKVIVVPGRIVNVVA